MSRQLRDWLIEIVILLLYKFFFEFVYMDRYMMTFSYLFNSYTYNFDIAKWLVSIFIFFILSFVLFFTRDSENALYSYLMRFIYTICIIPMLSVYSFFDGVDFANIIYPFLFIVILIYSIKKEANRKISYGKQLFRMPKILNVNAFILVVCAAISIVIWMWSGSPVFFDLSYALEQRIQLRESTMPTLLAYLFMFLGSTVFPYLFAKYMDEKKYILSIVSFLCGILLFFVNGMKTWLFLYLFYFGIALIFKVGKKKLKRTCILIDCIMLVLVIFSVLVYEKFGVIDIISQIARVMVIPNYIGFLFVSFFSEPENPFLFLRESVLRFLFDTPYVNGSDFFVTNGANVTSSSARANNGLWGDAYRNFGFIGLIVYPILISKVYSFVESNGRHMKQTLRLFVLFMVLWSSINNSFFTWLLTGGVFVIILLEKIDRANMEYNTKHITD